MVVKMKKNKWIKKIIIYLLLCIIVSTPLSVLAMEASLTFGSEYYTHEQGSEFRVGVYFKSNTPEFSYNGTLQYDPNMLEYIGGADMVEDGVLYFSGSEPTGERKYMLSFNALQEGGTVITVIGSQVVVGEENIPITVIGQAPISITPVVVEEEVIEEIVEEEIVAEENETVNVVIEEENVVESIDQGLNETETVAEIDAQEELESNTSEITIQLESVVDQTIKNPYAETEAIPNEIEFLILVIGVLAIVGVVFWIKKVDAKTKKEMQEIRHDEDEIEWLDIKDLDNIEEISEAYRKVEEEIPTIVDVKDVSMHFRINESNVSSLKEYAIKAIKREISYRNLYALNHIDFSIKKGEIVGVIGTNGSGKSTLLKIIAGVLTPTEGSVEVNRKKVQLLTLGTGFDVELTARENIYLNGAMVGYQKEFIDKKYEDIVAFAELEGFMEEKIKNFSSGMVSRLGFAIATIGETAEILILDEVLSVGDMLFQKKSQKRIREMIQSGSTVIIVSHSMDTIEKNCTRAIWIEKGNLREMGAPKKVCGEYRKLAQG